MGKPARNSSLLLAVSLIALIFLDQLSKFLIRGLVPNANVAGTSFFQIVNFSNTGSAFGLFRGSSAFLAALAAVAIATLAFSYRSLTGIQRVGAVFIAAGMAGNTIDRLLHGYVTDFILVGAWPAFNLADSFLFIGACVILYDAAKSRLSGKKSPQKK